MPMRATTVRFSESLWEMLEREAAREGVSAAQFVRDATVVRIAYALGQRGDADFESALERVSPGSGSAATLAGFDRAEMLRRANAAVNDIERLQALRDTGLLDTQPAPQFDRHARLAAEMLNTPVALVSLVASDRQFFKSCLGIREPWASRRQSPLSHSFCQHVVAQRHTLVIDDAREHAVLRDSMAIRDMGVIAYAGVPLIDTGGHALGTLCVIDSKPRHWSSHQVSLLEDLAAGVVTEISLVSMAGPDHATGPAS